MPTPTPEQLEEALHNVYASEMHNGSTPGDAMQARIQMLQSFGADPQLVFKFLTPPASDNKAPTV